jgi:hypothetical protein
VRFFSGRRWLFYVIIVAPQAVLLAALRLSGWDVGEWIAGITLAASIGSIVATEITFAQIRLRPRDMVRGIMEELARTPQGEKASRILDRLGSMLEEVDGEEARRIIREAMRTARTAVRDARTLAEFLHEFAERYRSARGQRLKAGKDKSE